MGGHATGESLRGNMCYFCHSVYSPPPQMASHVIAHRTTLARRQTSTVRRGVQLVGGVDRVLGNFVPKPLQEGSVTG